jgi:bifunctional hydroxylase/dehydrase
MVTGLDIRYDMGSGSHPLLGRRLPPADLVVGAGDASKATTFELLHAARGVLVDLAGDPRVARVAAPWADRVDTVSASPLQDGPFDGVDAVLVRPDGYIAWVGGTGAGPEGLADALTGWFGEPAVAA